LDWEAFKDLIGKEKVDSLQILLTEKMFHLFCHLLSFTLGWTGASQAAAVY